MRLLGKGMRVIAQGELSIQTWVDKECEVIQVNDS